jgi:hypothetical protein
MRNCFLLNALLLVAFAAGVARADPSAAPVPQATLADVLKAHRLPIRLENGVLRGAGAERLVRDAQAAQFVLVGEDHGFAEVPALTQALFRQLSKTGTRALVLEIGSQSAAAAERALRAGPGGLARLDAAHPFALPFLSLREEGALAGDVVRGAESSSLIGVDQEFILSPRVLLARLVELAPDDAARALAERYARRAGDAYDAMVVGHDPGQALLTRLEADEFNALRRAFRGAPSEADAIVAALETSAMIYKMQQTAPYESNRARSLLMKKSFMSRYASMAAREKNPRVLFKMGANHVGRGISPTGQFDIGNLASELAESGGQRSFHVLVVAAGGAANRWLPFFPDVSAKSTPYDAHAELDSQGLGPILEGALAGSWTYFELGALRGAAATREGGREFDELVYRYDAVVVIDVAHPAHFISD